MGDIRIVGPRDQRQLRGDWLQIDTTSGSTAEWTTHLSPFLLGPRAGGRLRTPGVLVEGGAQTVFVNGTGAEYNVLGVSSWRQLHGEITGAPSPKRRDFWCDGTAESPAFYGSERFGSNETSVLRYGDVPAVRVPAAAVPRRARPR